MTTRRKPTATDDHGPPPLETPDCCEVWPQILGRFDWMRFWDWPDLCSMPHLTTPGGTRYFVSFCPACGADRRNAKVARARILEARK